MLLLCRAREVYAHASALPVDQGLQIVVVMLRACVRECVHAAGAHAHAGTCGATLT